MKLSQDDCPTTPSKSLSRTGMASTTKSSLENSSADKNNIGTVLSDKIDLLPKQIQFICLAICVFFFFGIHNVLQEAMINTEGFTFGVMLGWMEVLGVTLCSGLERSSLPFIGNGEGRRPRMAPLCSYPPLTLCLLMSSSFASWSLNYINFPTKVVFRSCKLLPTMILAVMMGNAKRFTIVEVGSAMAVCAGLIIFAAGDWSLSTPQFHPFGLTIVTLSVFADAVLPNAQEKLFRTYDASKSEVMFYTNVFTLVVQSGSAYLSGDLTGMFRFVMGGNPSVKNGDLSLIPSAMTERINSTTKVLRHEMQGYQRILDFNIENAIIDPESSVGHIRQTFLTYMVSYIIISHVAVSAHTAVVKKFGGVAAVFVGTARKGMTLVLSFLLFPKECNWKYAVGAFLVLGGLTVASLEKQRNKLNKPKVARGSDVQSNTFTGKNGFKIDPLAIPSLPLNGGLMSSNQDNNSYGENEDNEARPLLKLDIEMGRPSPGSGAGRRRV